MLHPRAKKSLGQNFLRDANIARKIVDALEVRAEDAVLEIGPGPGALTAILQERGPARLLLVEKDEHWAAERLRRGMGPGGDEELRPAQAESFTAAVSGQSAFGVVVADALALPWEALSAPWKIIGNLPYNIASPLMWEIFSRAGGLTRAVFMIQKEVGLRIAAKPGTSAYGALSVWVQSHVLPKLEFIVPPQVFVPRPKVDSAVLSFVPHAAGRFDFPPDALAETLKVCFQMRRKQMGTIARACGGSPGLLHSLGISAERRPEALQVEEFHALARARIFCGRH